MSLEYYYTLSEIKRFKKVVFYTILEEADGQKLYWFVDFIQKIDSHDAGGLKKLMFEMGNKYGAQKNFFRHEGAADALPPSRIDAIDINRNLRLYCLRINNNAVILFNGGYKDAPTAQASSISYHFQQANSMSKKIIQALKERFIRIKKDNTLEWDEDLYL